MRRAAGLLIAVASAALVAGGCRFPADVEGTLDRAEGGTLRVGVVDNPPWVELGSGEPRGVEPELLRGFAATIDARIEWIPGPAEELAAAMGGFQIDVLAGGLTRQFPYPDDVAMTAPYVDTEIEIGVPPGTKLPGDLGGERIWVQNGSEAAALLREEEDDAVPVPYDSLDEVDGPVLTHTYEIDALDFERTDYILRDDEHALGVPPGENALMVELESFLLDRGEEAEDLLHRLEDR